MLRNTLLLCSLIACLFASAQWKTHPIYVGTNTTEVIDAGNKVFYLVGGTLCVFDKSSEVTEIWTNENKLSDQTVAKMFYNYEAEYLLIAYNNSNIDIVRPDGSVSNLPDLNTTVVSASKQINHVTFSGNRAILATDFGYAVADINRMQITEFHNFGQQVFSVTPVGNIIFVATADSIYYTTEASVESLRRLTNTGIELPGARLTAIDSNHFFAVGTAAMGVYTIDEANAVTATSTIAAVCNNIQPTPGGFIANFLAAGYYYTYDATGGSATKVSGGKVLFSAHPDGDGTLWGVAANGLYKRGTSTYYKPNGLIGITAGIPYWMAYNRSTGHLLLSNTSDNAVLPSIAYSNATQLYDFDGNAWTAVTPANRPNGANYWLVYDPNDPTSLWYSTRTAGLVHIQNGTLTTHAAANSPYTSMMAIDFDCQGNLWGIMNHKNTESLAWVLPKDNLNATPSASNWQSFTIPGLYVGKNGYFKRSSFVISKPTNVCVYSVGDYYMPLHLWTVGSTLNADSLRTVSYTGLYDQNGRAYNVAYVRCLAADADGNVWMGTNDGVCFFNPLDAFTDNFRVTRPEKADNTYLFDGLAINCIAVDSQNRKWVATNADGLFLISADGSEIIKEYTPGNSNLPSLQVYQVCPMDDGQVMITSSMGVNQLVSDDDASAQQYADYSRVQANPATLMPDYTGMVTISGLMDGSVVRITAADGSVVAEPVPAGNMALWNPIDNNGNRLPTGLYTISAAQTAAELQPVARVRIVR